MQDPNEDTEWNDILRAKGVLPPKEKGAVTLDQIESMVEEAVNEKTTFGNGNVSKDIKEMTLDELDEIEDEAETKILEQMRRKRLSEMKTRSEKKQFGSVLEISGIDYVSEVNEAGLDVTVVLHLYARGIPMCGQINQHMSKLAYKFKTVKFVKAIAVTCIPNFPESNTPSIFIYRNGKLQHQIIGPTSFPLEYGSLKYKSLKAKLETLSVFEGVQKVQGGSDSEESDKNDDSD